MTAGEIAAAIGIASAGCGLIGWFSRGVWIAAGKSTTLDGHSKAIAAITNRCEAQKEKILTEVKQSVCDGVQLAIKGLELEYIKKHAATDQNVAVLDKRVEVIESDVENIFSRVRALEMQK